ncbi:DUF3298 and DUF4163 domain-containing protein [Hyphomonas pacifica]|nr:DUF3298 and DUF4163 domain-containing protein [Hyphomonas pacifica]
MKTLAMATLAGALLLAGCQKKVRELPDAGEAVAGQGDDYDGSVDVTAIETLADLPREILVDDEYLKAEVTFDEGLFQKAPAIAMDVVDSAQIRIEAMLADAKAYKEADPDYFRPYVVRVQWNVVAEAGNVMSLEGFIYTFTGGAHGNYMTDARLYDSQTGQPMRLSNFFLQPQATIREHMNLVWQEIAEQKQRKAGGSGQLETFAAEAAELVNADSILAGEVNFVPSTVPGKFGGYVVHFAPYDIGAYAEGAYHITVPQSAFRDKLKPEYLNLFDGQPAPVERMGD